MEYLEHCEPEADTNVCCKSFYTMENWNMVFEYVFNVRVLGDHLDKTRELNKLKCSKQSHNEGSRRLMCSMTNLLRGLLDFNSAPDHGQCITEIEWTNRKVRRLKDLAVTPAHGLLGTQSCGDKRYRSAGNTITFSWVHWCRRKTRATCNVGSHRWEDR